MILITGKNACENAQFAKQLNAKDDEIFDITKYLRENFQVENFQILKEQACEIAKSAKVAFCEELGCVVSPLSFEKRRFQELNGETAKETAVHACEVFLVENAVGVKIK